MNRSAYALIFCFFIMALAGNLYYPKWQKTRGEATISWDVAGYYLYLPALFIYEDVKGCGFADSLLRKYESSPYFDQAFKHESGNYVMKYTAGMAVQYLPFFAIAHVWALNSDEYPADGYSRPYQFMIYLGCLLMAFLGLFYLRKVLLLYFNDTSVAITLILIAMGTNFLEYASITNAMTHGTLFAWYSILIYISIQLHDNPKKRFAAGAGLICGLIALTRPTELISILIPLLWGSDLLSKNGIRERFDWWKKHFGLLMLMGICSIIIGSIQMIYWKYASGDWIVYSYQDQGFSWLKPHIWKGLFSYNNGWLPYSPVMIFALIGFISLYRINRQAWMVPALYFALFIYIAFAWDIWWYGGSLGQRTMVQVYPLLAFPLAAFLQSIDRTKWLKYPLYLIMFICVYVSMWWVHQAHKGGMFLTEQMTKRYYWNVLGTYEIKDDNLKYLDTKDVYKRTPKNSKVIYENKLNDGTVYTDCSLPPIEGAGTFCVTKDVKNSPMFSIPLSPGAAKWLRASATFQTGYKEWNPHNMTQFHIRAMKGDQPVKERYIRVHRLLHDGQLKDIHQDFKLPKDDFDRIEIFFWHPNEDKEIRIGNIKAEIFDK
jgi:hypothetical protein